MDNRNFIEMYNHLQNLETIRNVRELRTGLIYQCFSISFLSNFSEHVETLETCLTDIEKIASEMDTVKKNVSITNVAGGTVGIVSGVLFITGLALAPVTLGASTALTIAGAAVGAAAGLGGAVASIAEVTLNRSDQKKIQEILNTYKHTIAHIKECIGIEELVFREVFELQEENIQERNQNIDKNEILSAELRAGLQIAGAGRAVASMVDDIVSLSRMGDVVGDVARVGVRGAGQGALRIVGGVGSGIFMVVDLYSICKNSIALAKGKKNETAEIMRKIVAELRCELETYKQLYEVLESGMKDIMINMEALENDSIFEQ
ncbi:apolipoprotein L6-like [Polypterus senegalus]|uniref:apolipoprotein L6-like n=1 Tax=Polypterus senegalus TaxID=55291 RepID=UPI0019655549|nr:apolipoprotein L6-like [Polypterus senegalus]